MLLEDDGWVHIGMRYIAFIHKEPDRIYGVSFPDVPGCISAGDTIDEAVRNAVEALSGHMRRR